MKLQDSNKIIIYKTKSGIPQIDVKVEKDTVWLSQKQIADLFDVNVPAISKHINNIYIQKELDEKSTVSKMETVQKEGAREVIRKVDNYNLDMIVPIGYRVNSQRATQFRIWATNILKQHMLKGYSVNQKLLVTQKEKLVSLKEAINFIEKKADTYLLQGKSRELLSLVNEFAKTLTLLEEYDKNKIKIKKTAKTKFEISYQSCKNIIIELKAELKKENEAGDLFGQEYNKRFQAIIGSIYQTFDGKELYGSIEEKAAHLIYLIIKDHPFADGNKRIASFLFVYFLRENDYLYTANMQRKISNNTLVPLALLVASSDPREKETIIKIIINLLQ